MEKGDLPLSPNPEFNPYAAPLDRPVPEGDPEEKLSPLAAEMIRRKHLSHEASVKAIGSLAIVGAGLCFLLMLLMLGMAAGLIAKPAGTFAELDDSELGLVVGGVIFCFFGIVSGFAGIGLRKLASWARWTETVLSSLGLLTAIATINIFSLAFNTYVLYLMLSPKGAMVFSPEYQQVIAQTPDIKYQMSKVIKVLLMILVIFLGMILTIAAIAFLGTMR